MALPIHEKSGMANATPAAIPLLPPLINENVNLDTGH